MNIPTSNSFHTTPPKSIHIGSYNYLLYLSTDKISIVEFTNAKSITKFIFQFLMDYFFKQNYSVKIVCILFFRSLKQFISARTWRACMYIYIFGGSTNFVFALDMCLCCTLSVYIDVGQCTDTHSVVYYYYYCYYYYYLRILPERLHCMYIAHISIKLSSFTFFTFFSVGVEYVSNLLEVRSYRRNEIRKKLPFIKIYWGRGINMCLTFLESDLET